MKGSGKASKGRPKPPPDFRSDKRSATGFDGAAKKSGHGGKFTWSGDLSLSHDNIGFVNGALDSNDPNFVDPEDEDLDAIRDAFDNMGSFTKWILVFNEFDECINQARLEDLKDTGLRFTWATLTSSNRK